MTSRKDNRKDNPPQPVRIIACGVFRPVLEELKLTELFPGLRVTYLPSNLHVHPHELEKFLIKEITASQDSDEHTICLYGECFPDIGVLCRQHGVVKVEAHHCYEIFLGRDKFREIMDESARTYFLEKDLILNFEEYCAKPLELYDREMRDLFFKNYERLVYVRQPSDPDLMPEVNRIAELLGLSVKILDADYSALKKILIDIIGHSLK